MENIKSSSISWNIISLSDRTENDVLSEKNVLFKIYIYYIIHQQCDKNCRGSGSLLPLKRSHVDFTVLIYTKNSKV